MSSSSIKKIILIGASTGGPGQIQKIITAVPKLTQTTIIIAQHMVDGFMNSFASRLQTSSKNSVSVIENDQGIESAKIYLCEGDTYIKKVRNRLIFTQTKSSESSFNPDINVLFHSFTNLSKEFEILSIILTGIGDDGVDACKALSQNGATCITETEQSAIVDGMTSRARDVVPNIKVYNMQEIIKSVVEFCE